MGFMSSINKIINLVFGNNKMTVQICVSIDFVLPDIQASKESTKDRNHGS